jgi:hypothetical protein
MAIVRVSPPVHRPAPPASLTATESKVWRAVVNDAPSGWFTAAQEPLLTAYCRHVVSSDQLAAVINKEGLDASDVISLRRFSRLLMMRHRESSMLMTLATKMRLTQQAQMHPRSAGRAFDNANLGRKPWEYP